MESKMGFVPGGLAKSRYSNITKVVFKVLKNPAKRDQKTGWSCRHRALSYNKTDCCSVARPVFSSFLQEKEESSIKRSQACVWLLTNACRSEREEAHLRRRKA